MEAKTEKLLTKVAESFKELAKCVDSPTPRLEVGQFASASRLVASIIGHLGMAFKFASIEFSAKIDALMEASKSIDTLEALIDHDIEQNCAKVSNSNSRDLVRVKRSIDMLRVIYEQILIQR
ncbi:unnamed protein product [Ilex paraguariensis]|uniref:Glycolipid transfer protein domain-containing protein n=1 Tax=Ilex paraguariensis TaxID=185542 RepID=A0ABC8QXS4_9AQUA